MEQLKSPMRVLEKDLNGQTEFCENASDKFKNLTVDLLNFSSSFQGNTH